MRSSLGIAACLNVFFSATLLDSNCIIEICFILFILKIWIETKWASGIISGFVREHVKVYFCRRARHRLDVSFLMLSVEERLSTCHTVGIFAIDTF